MGQLWSSYWGNKDIITLLGCHIIQCEILIHSLAGVMFREK